MSRTVVAIYTSRAEAETARARVLVQLDAADVQILGRGDRGEVDRFGFSTEDRDNYREALFGGDFLLCAHVRAEEDPDRIVQILTEAISTPSPADGQIFLTEPGGRDGYPAPTDRSVLFVSDTRILRGGARVQLPAAQDDPPTSERSRSTIAGTARVYRADLLAAGLFTDRKIEASEMGEVPVIDRHAVVREEVVLRKVVSERTETVTDTVRRTAIEVTELDPDRAGERSHTGRKM